MSEIADGAWRLPPRELLTKNALDIRMRKIVLSAALCAAMVGVALAQVEASSSTYFLDVDPARYAGPVGQRVVLRVGDQPRNVTIGTQDEICVQLQRVEGSDVINARIRALRPQPQMATDVPLVGPGISPGTYRSTHWGLLLRAIPGNSDTGEASAMGTENAPVCTL
jgi:hypothetical protein